MRRIGRSLVAASALVVLAAACSTETVPVTVGGDTASSVLVAPAAPPAPPVDDDALDDAAMQATLDTAAAAFLAADSTAIRAALLSDVSPFGMDWVDRASNLRGVPLSHYALRLDPSLPDLSTEAVRKRYAPADVVVRYVIEEHALRGFDTTGPVAEDLFLTLVSTDDGWRIASDSDGEVLGFVSVDHLWDHGAVEFTDAGAVAALHHPGTPRIAEVLQEAQVALGEVEAAWPLDWPRRVPIIVPRDEEELGELLHVTFDLSNFIAFATATPTGELGAFELTGPRVVVNSTRFLDRSSDTRRSILAHELLHVATRSVTGPMVPSWVEEGLAQKVGENRSTTGTRLLDQLVASGRFRGDLPTDTEFTIGGRDRIFLSYQLAWGFVDHLVRRYGTDDVARFYATLGQGEIGQPGRESWHVDRAAREVFGSDLAGLQAQWQAARGA